MLPYQTIQTSYLSKETIQSHNRKESAIPNQGKQQGIWFCIESRYYR
jgi:hypothetical protein